MQYMKKTNQKKWLLKTSFGLWSLDKYNSNTVKWKIISLIGSMNISIKYQNSTFDNIMNNDNYLRGRNVFLKID